MIQFYAVLLASFAICPYKEKQTQQDFYCGMPQATQGKMYRTSFLPWMAVFSRVRLYFISTRKLLFLCDYFVSAEGTDFGKSKDYLHLEAEED